MSINLNTVATDIKLATSILSLALTVGQALEGPVAALIQLVFTGEPLTDQQRANLLASHKAMSDALQAPLAPEQVGGAA
ncbi:MAG: hypothetical protein ACTHJ3_07775 [Pararhizobium sp.]